jgi:cytoskeletal protein CcmA (bactofilin family)
MAFWNTTTSSTGTTPSTSATQPERPADAAPARAPQPPTAPAQPPAREKETPMAMMKRDESTAGAGSDLLLGQGAEFEGKLTFAGTVRIDAKFKGSIVTNDVLVVGEHARIDADITCGTVIVHGEVNGNIKAKSAVELHHPAKVRGNVETPSLMLEKGVVFQGESRMGLEKAGSKSAPGLSTATAAAPAAS